MGEVWRRDPFEALGAVYAAFARATPGFSLATIGRPGSLICAVTPLALSLFNRVMSVRLAADEVDEAIEGVQAAHARASVPGSWWLGPGTTPGTLPQALERHGYSSSETIPAMTLELDQLSPLQLPPGVELSWVNGRDQMRATQRMIGIGFGMPPALAHEMAESLAAIGEDPSSPARVVVASLDGTPVSSAMAVTVGDVAGVYSVATLPEARGKGLGMAITLAVLHDARDRGARHGVLESSDMGFPIYTRMGFRHVGDFRVFVSG